MNCKAFVIGASLLAIVQPALAQVSGESNQAPGSQQSQNPQQPQQPQSQNQAQQQTQTPGEKLRQNLQSAGFSDIQLMPSSFLVRAKDRDGNPVMMVVNPDSITAVTEIGGGNPDQDSRSTTGQGGGEQKTNPAQNQQNNPSHK